MITLKTRLLGLIATLGILAFVIGTPALLLTINAVPTGSFSWNVLRSPDDGTVAMAVIGVVAWAAWALMTASLALETLAGLRGVRAPRLPGLGVPQLAAGRVIAVATLLFVASPHGGQASPVPAPSVAEVPLSVVSAPFIPTPQPTPIVETPTEQASPPATVTYLTKRGDSLWKIADEHLGDGRRYLEIVALNADAINGRPDFLPVGLILRLPIPEDSSARGDSPTHVVEPGDTLSEIAAETLGDPMRYPELVEASRDTMQPDGERLTDPDLIRPGWRITIPGTPNHGAAESHRNGQSSPRTWDATPRAEATETPSTTASAEPTQHNSAPEAHDTTPDADDDGTLVPGWLLPGLAGGGAVLACALLLVVRAHRRTQLRHRLPGHVIARPPAELLPVEKTLQVMGAPMLPRIEKLDDLLRHLRANVGEIPAVLHAVELTAETATLHLAEAADLPAPWRGSGTRWLAPLDADVPTRPDEPAPYPLLVTMGQDDNGHLWLINLEQLQNVAITGHPPNAEALGRHLVAELALNPWSRRVEVIALGIGRELEGLSHRLTHHAPGEDGVLAKVEDQLTGDNGFDGVDPESFHAVVTAGPSADVAATAALIAEHRWRAGAAVVSLGDPMPNGAAEFRVTASGRLHVTALGLDLIACGLTDGEGAVCAAIVDLTRDAENEPMPNADTDAEDELGSMTDASGALRVDLTRARPEGPAGAQSVLPLSSAEYEANTATTETDVATLAPITPVLTRRRIEQADPTLDEDLAAWLDPEARVPKVTLLGPVTARAFGNPTIVAKRKPFYVELLAYLALHPYGVSAGQAASDFALTKERMYVDLTTVRKWLGIDARTGEEHMPRLRATAKPQPAGESSYRVQGVLSDADLFKRLRARGEARGAEGVADLERALRLVSGEPFSDLRPAGWNWLLEGERIDHIMTCAIVDVAHIVTTHALATHDFTLARLSAETGYRAAPYDDISCLDLVEVAAVTGHNEIAERHLIDSILNRSDDDYGPIGLSERTAKIVKLRGWDGLHRAKR